MTAPAWATRRTEAEQHAAVRALSYSLLDAALTVRIALGLGQPDQARHQLERAFAATVQLDAVLPPELHDPPPALAGERSPLDRSTTS